MLSFCNAKKAISAAKKWQLAKNTFSQAYYSAALIEYCIYLQQFRFIC
jgi:hypothetical protein